MIDINLRLRAWFLERGLSRSSRFDAREQILQRKGLNVSKKSLTRAGEEFALCAKYGVGVINFTAAEYPRRLLNIEDAPVQLFLRGKLQVRREERYRGVVAIVGTRMADNFGKCLSSGLARELRRNGILVVSGLARGIDSAAHVGALSDIVSRTDREIGPGMACLGGGILRVYPRENHGLAEDLVNNGGAIVSEYGLFEPPKKHHFPERNRIISGLSDLVVVVQADLKSGSVITANLAADQGRDVAVFPGRVNERLAAGTLELARNGATLVRSGEEVLEVLGLKPLAAESEIEQELSADKRRVLELVAREGSAHFDDLAICFSDGVKHCARSLSELERAGWLIRETGDYYAPGLKCAKL